MDGSLLIPLVQHFGGLNSNKYLYSGLHLGAGVVLKVLVIMVIDFLILYRWFKPEL